MVGHYIAYFIGFIAVFAYNILDYSYIPFIVDVVFIVISIVSLAVALFIRSTVTAEFVSNLIVTERGQNAKVIIRLKNTSYVPANYCRFKLKCRYSDQNVKTYKIDSHCVANGVTEAIFEIPCNQCQSVRIEAARIYVYDYLRIIMLSRRIDISSCVLVMPQIPDVGVISKMQKDISEDDGLMYSTEKPGDDPTEIFAIREYEGGDKIRNIHWKLTAKTDKLMVKDYGLPLTDHDRVVVDIFPMGKKEYQNVINQVYDLLCGLITVMTKRGYGLTVSFVNKTYVEKRIETQSDIYGLFAELYETPPVTGESAAELYYASRGKEKTRVFYVTDHYNDETIKRLCLLEDTGQVYYLIPTCNGGGEYLIRFNSQGENK
jgi:uncharacterized protein (DUF58 family)